MSVDALIQEIRSLSDDDRERVLDAFRDPPAAELSAAQLLDLDRRLAEDDANPDAGEPWEVVKARIQGHP